MPGILTRLVISRGRRLHPWLWIAFALIWVVSLGVDYGLTFLHDYRVGQWQQHQDALDALAQGVMKPVDELLAQCPARMRMIWPGFFHPTEAPLVDRIRLMLADWMTRGPVRPSKVIVERLLNEGKPFRTTRKQVAEERYSYLRGRTLQVSVLREVADYVDPTHGLRFRLSFLDGEFEGYELVVPKAGYPQPPLLLRLGGEFQTAFKGADRMMWLGLLLLGLAWRRQRCLMAQLMIMVALSGLIVRMPPLVPQVPSVSSFGIDFLPWGIAMISAGLAMLSWGYFAEEARHRLLCRVCEYNLAGNQSGICPECGTVVPDDVRRRLAMTSHERCRLAAG